MTYDNKKNVKTGYLISNGTGMLFHSFWCMTAKIPWL